MKRIACVLMIILVQAALLRAKSEDPVWYPNTYVHIQSIDRRQYPEIWVQFSYAVKGQKLANAQAEFTQKLELFENKAPLSIKDVVVRHDLKKMDVHVLLDPNFLQREDSLGVTDLRRKLGMHFQVSVHLNYLENTFVPMMPEYWPVIEKIQRPDFIKSAFKYAKDLIQGSNEETLFILFSDFTRMTDEEIIFANHFLELIENQTYVWFAFVELRSDDHKVWLSGRATNRCLFYSTLKTKKRDNLDEMLLRMDDFITGNQMRLVTETADRRGLHPVINYVLRMTDKDSSKYSLRQTKEEAKNCYLKAVKKETDYFIYKIQYNAALDNLRDAYQRLPDADIVSYAYDPLKGKCDALLLKTEANTINAGLRDMESRWPQFTRGNARFDELKAACLKKELENQETQGGSLKDQLSACEAVLGLQPGLVVYQVKQADLKGEMRLADNDYWGALSHFSEADRLKADTAMQAKISRTFARAVMNDYKTGDFVNLYAGSRKYESHVRDSFANAYVYAKSCEETRHFAEAVREYEWVLQHWDNGNTLVTWDKAFDDLESLYIKALDFDKAFDLIKRGADKNPVRPATISPLILNLHAKYARPLLDVGEILFSRLSPQETGTLFAEYQRVIRDPFVQACYLLNRNLSVLQSTRPSGEHVPGSVQIQGITSFPAFILESGQNATGWLIARIPSGYFVIEISSNTDPETNNKLRPIYDNAQNEDAWFSLYDLKRMQGCTYLSQALTLFLAQVIQKQGPDQLGSYWNILQKDAGFKYGVFHDAQGTQQSSSGFARSSLSMDESNWKRSSSAQALYRQEDVKYGNTAVIDLCNPVYGNGQYRGTIRLGFKKY
ncbi:hypothetical protein JW948_09015 [bacterium]|nr:hypothetical protein [bacterium]